MVQWLRISSFRGFLSIEVLLANLSLFLSVKGGFGGTFCLPPPSPSAAFALAPKSVYLLFFLFRLRRGMNVQVQPLKRCFREVDSTIQHNLTYAI